MFYKSMVWKTNNNSSNKIINVKNYFILLKSLFEKLMDFWERLTFSTFVNLFQFSTQDLNIPS